MIRQGIISIDGFTINCMKLRINAGDKSVTPPQDKAIADTYGNKFIIPLDLEMLESLAPYYQEGLGNRLCYEIMFNDYNQATVICTELRTSHSLVTLFIAQTSTMVSTNINDRQFLIGGSIEVE